MVSFFVPRWGPIHTMRMSTINLSTAVAPLAISTTSNTLKIMGAGFMSSLGFLTTLSPVVITIVGAGAAAVTGIAGVATAFVAYKALNHVKATYNILETTGPPTNGYGLYSHVNKQVDRFDMLHEETIDQLFDKADEVLIYEKKPKKVYLPKGENTKFLDENTSMPPVLKKMLHKNPHVDSLHASEKVPLLQQMKDVCQLLNHSENPQTDEVFIVEEVEQGDGGSVMFDRRTLYGESYAKARAELQKRKRVAGKLTKEEYLYLFCPQFYHDRIHDDAKRDDIIRLENHFELIGKAADESQAFGDKFHTTFVAGMARQGIEYVNTLMLSRLMLNIPVDKGHVHMHNLQSIHWTDRARALYFFGYNYLWNDVAKDFDHFTIINFMEADISYEGLNSTLDPSNGFVCCTGSVPNGEAQYEQEDNSSIELVEYNRDYSANKRRMFIRDINGNGPNGGGPCQVQIDPGEKIEAVVAWKLFYTKMSALPRSCIASSADYYYFNSRLLSLCDEYGLDAQESHCTVHAAMFALTRPRSSRRTLGQAIDVVLSSYSTSKNFFSRLLDV